MSVKKWFKNFRSGHINISNGEHSLLHISATTAQIIEKSPQKVIFRHGNASAHTSAVAAEKLMKLGFQVVSLGLLLVLQDEEMFGGKKFSNEEVIAKSNAYLTDLEKSYYSEGINN
ncbi:hypothetical protein YQE_08564, partial [Dendroctonus ponderosae]